MDIDCHSSNNLNCFYSSVVLELIEINILKQVQNTLRTNLKRLRLLIFQLIGVQTTIETFRVLAVLDCSFDPQFPSAYVMDAMMTVSFMAGIWAIIIVLRIDYKRLKRYKCIKKFLVFKVMIAVSKFLGRILGLMARTGVFKGYKNLGATQRSLSKSVIFARYVVSIKK